MSAREDYLRLAQLVDLNTHRRNASLVVRDTAMQAAAALDEIDWLRNSLGELLARLATVATPDEWKRPV